MLYLDTSALVKLYLDEHGRKSVTAAVASQTIVATQEIAYIEANAAFARAEREKRLDHRELERLRSDFDRDWPSFLVLRVSQPLLEQAVRLVDSFALRAYDAMHLAAARMFARESDEQLVFGCFDRRLNQAAELLGMRLMAVE